MSDRERWELAVAISQQISRQHEPDGVANNQFVFFMARQVYFSDIPMGSPDDPPVELETLNA